MRGSHRLTIVTTFSQSATETDLTERGAIAMCTRLLKLTGVLVAALIFPLSLSAAEIYVAPNGNDADPGTRAAPLRTLAAARDAVRPVAGKETVTVHVADGVYYLPETLVFTSADSGTDDYLRHLCGGE